MDVNIKAGFLTGFYIYERSEAKHLSNLLEINTLY